MAHLSARTLKETKTQLVLELAYLMAHRRRRNAELTSRLGEAHEAARGFQRPKSAQPWNTTHILQLSFIDRMKTTRLLVRNQMIM
jgi:hypothetical protein